MSCCNCGIPYLGIATDGRPYCHKCVDWKLELQKHRDRRAA